MNLTKVTTPSGLPISLTSVKDHLRIDPTDTGYDSDLTELIRAAAELVESETHLTLGTTQFTAKWEFFRGGILKLPAWPVSTVDSVKYLDTDGATQTLSASLYRTSLVQVPATIRPAINTDWPLTQTDALDGVTVTFTAGYGSASAQPYMVRHLLKLLVGHWFLHREAVLTGTITAELPLAAQTLFGQLRVNEFEEFLVQ